MSRDLTTARRRKVTPRFVLRIAIAVLLLALAVNVTVGGDIARLTIANQTDHFLHIIVDGEPFLYVSPGAGATFEKEGYSTVIAKAFYAPGQGVSGKAERSFVIAPYEPASTGCDWANLECENTTATGGPRMWEVTPDSLRVATPTGAVTP
jgi:hypothetical protein